MRKIILASAALIITCACFYSGNKSIRGNGIIDTTFYNVKDFTAIEASGMVDLYIVEDRSWSLKVQADRNLFDYVNVLQLDSQLIISSSRKYNLLPTEAIKVFITAPYYKSLKILGSANIYGQEKLTDTGPIKLDLQGVGEIKLWLNASQVIANVSGAGSLQLKGAAQSLDLNVDGIGYAGCYELLADSTNVHVLGSCSAEVYAGIKLTADARGSGNIDYKGPAVKVKQYTSGSGKIYQTNKQKAE